MINSWGERGIIIEQNQCMFCSNSTRYVHGSLKQRRKNYVLINLSHTLNSWYLIFDSLWRLEINFLRNCSDCLNTLYINLKQIIVYFSCIIYGSIYCWRKTGAEMYTKYISTYSIMYCLLCVIYMLIFWSSTKSWCIFVYNSNEVKLTFFFCFVLQVLNFSKKSKRNRNVRRMVYAHSSSELIYCTFSLIMLQCEIYLSQPLRNYRVL